MEALELLELIQQGESSRVQFKERLPHIDSLAQEMVAFSNTEGGIIIIGVNDKTGDLNGLSFQELQSVNQQLVNVASQSVFPPIVIKTETVRVNEQNLVVVELKEGISKPYKDRSGAIFMKNGSDKRRVTSNDEIARLLQSSKIMFADELPVVGSTIADIDVDLFNKFIHTKYGRGLEDMGIDLPKSLENLNLLSEGQLTLAGLLLFSDRRQQFRPQFTIQCVSVDADDITGSTFSDSEAPIEGNMLTVFQKAIGFVDRNMRKQQTGSSFNSPAIWEIPYEVFEELLVNALIHRDYFIQSTIKIFIFRNRVEIHSPGKLPNSLTVENIRNGISIARNPILQSVAQFVLPYKGLGTGVSRAVALYPNIDFANDTQAEQFKVIIQRP
ncbi:RNA-binding domain-containing protein [Sphingobacterium sp. R2]|uniref:RNA-binding domain-containing protein n=1 Tax=Sphingobacterium sp. R2 TaxID=3112958 RepID=UPI00345C9411